MVSIAMDVATRRLQERRLAGLQAMSLAVSVGSAVFFAAYFVAGAGLATAGAVGIGVALLVGALMVWFRRTYPPSIEAASEEREPEPPTSDTYGWELDTFMIAAVVVPLILVAGLVVRFMLPLAIVLAFWIANDDVSTVRVLVAAGCCLAVLACVEFGIEVPLSRRWGLPLDTKARPREDYCPPPNGGK